MSALELVSVSRRRGAGRQAVWALREVSLRTAPGEVVLLEGPSGSGKTTLLAVAAGLLGADEGTVRLAGVPLAGMDRGDLRRLRARQVGFVFQRSNLLANLSGLDNVLLQGALAGLEAGEAGRRARELLEALGVLHLADRAPRQLSAGEEQRFAVARALVHRPALVLADEPTASVDAAAGQAVAGLLTALAAERGAAVIVATHDPRLASLRARRVRLLDGRIAAPAPPEAQDRAAGAEAGR